MSEVDQEGLSPIGERLKKAREAKNLSLDDVASQTRIPTRHLQSIERGDWDDLPAPTYSIGFAKSYANAVGLNGSQIAAELRDQIGTTKPKYNEMPSYYEPADPARVPPKSLALIAGVLALLLAIGYAIWRSGAVDDTGQSDVAGIETPLPEAASAPADPNLSANQPLGGPSAAGANGPVVLTATDDVWLRVYEAEGGERLFENTLRAGQRYEVPSNAERPLILTGRPDALRVTVGATEIPPLGPPERTISDVSLLPSDLVARAGGGTAQPQTQQPQTPAAQPRQ